MPSTLVIIVFSESRYLAVFPAKHASKPATGRFRPLLFLIYINDITDLLSSADNMKLAADDI